MNVYGLTFGLAMRRFPLAQAWFRIYCGFPSQDQCFVFDPTDNASGFSTNSNLRLTDIKTRTLVQGLRNLCFESCLEPLLYLMLKVDAILIITTNITVI
jgi:hypothetical protein